MKNGSGLSAGARCAGPALAAATLLFLLPSLLSAQSLRVERYVGGLTRPLAFVQDPTHAGVQFVVEQDGRVRVILNGVLQATPFLDLTGAVLAGGERGLLGLAFAPDYATSRRFFVNFTRAGDGATVVARFRRSPGNPLLADAASRFDLVWSTGLDHIPQPFSNHNGGQIAFGPDGYLYLAMGDGGDGGDPYNHAQNPDSLLGKMLRVDVAVPDSDPQGLDVPPDNPFLDGVPVAARPEIWSFGWRNPWRWSFDDPVRGGTGGMIVADVGQRGWEEIDYEPAGRAARNYGWRVREGAHTYAGGTPAFAPLTDPVFELDRSLARSIIGGFVYRGSRLPDHRGRYFFADFVVARLYSIALRIDATTGEATAHDFVDHTADVGVVGGVSAFGVDADGEIYIVNWSAGEVLRLLPAANAPPAATLVAPAGTIATPRPVYRWNAVPQSDYYYLWVSDSGGVRTRQWYSSASAACPAGTGQCSVPAPDAVRAGGATWWIQTWSPSGYGPWSSGLAFTVSTPPAPPPLSPAGSIGTTRPAFSWSASALASHYYLWVTDATGNRIRQWYPAAAAGCGAGTGTCAVTPQVRLTVGDARWWVQAWNEVGYGPWSAARPFSVTPPVAATLVSPGGSIGTTTPAYTWNAVPSATHYYLWVDDSAGARRVQQWHTAASAGCAGGTGTCSVTPAVTLSPGQARWWIQTWNDAGYGPWSAGVVFTVP